MAIWTVRGCAKGRYQDFALENNQAVIGWKNMGDLSQYSDKEALSQAVANAYADAKPKTRQTWATQLWALSHRIQQGDIVAMPIKGKNIISFGVTVHGVRPRITDLGLVGS